MTRALLALFLAAAAFSGQDAPEETELERYLRLAREGSPVVRPQAAQRLVRLGEPAAEAVLAASGGTTAGLATLGVDLVEVLGQLESDALRDDLWTALGDPDFPWRPSAARSLSRTARAAESGRFVALSADPLAAVRVAAVAGLGTLDDRALLDRVVPLLLDPQDRVRREAALLLDRWGDPCALSYVVEDLRRTDRFFDLDTGKIARFEAFGALRRRFGEGFEFAPERPPTEPENAAAIGRIAARVAELCEDPPELPTVARAGQPVAGEAFGLEVRSCRRGEFFLRWTDDDRLLVGTGNALALELPEGTVAGLRSTWAKLASELESETFWGLPGCDVEAFYLSAPEGERAEVLRVSKGPDAVEDLRPKALSAWSRALVDTLPQAQGLRASVREALGAVGGEL
ncbi:MAG: HEAT repeat domain-containing protein [Planctomycetota bacterium]